MVWKVPLSGIDSCDVVQEQGPIWQSRLWMTAGLTSRLRSERPLDEREVWSEEGHQLNQVPPKRRFER